MSRIAATLVFLCSSSLGAVDAATTVEDLRLSIGVGPSPRTKSGEYTSPALAAGIPVEEHYSSSPITNVAVTVAYGQLAPLGLVWGGEFRYTNGTQQLESIDDGLLGPVVPGRNPPDFTWTTTGLAANLGAGYAIGPRVHLELVGILGIVRVAADSPANISNPDALQTQRGTGWGHIFGLRAGLFYTDESHWQIGLVGEWTRLRAKIDTSYFDATVHFDAVEVNGLSASGSVGYRF